MKVIFIFFPALFLPLAGFSQFYSTGEDPASVSWRQIKTDRYRLVYPSAFGNRAQYLANILDLVTREETYTLTADVPRIPVVLHSQSALSNGLTVWAPRRIELYPCPPQQTYAEEWLEQLAIHEYRHAVQVSKINRGFSRVLSRIFGEQITGGILGLYVPSWFLEGDATVTETSLTRSGRGRSALFECTLRAQLAGKGICSYDKATLGSYKTFTPDAYSLGYYLVGQSRKKYGPALWNTALDRVAKYPFMVVPFNSGIHKVTGMWKSRLYRQTLTYLDSAWKEQSRNTNLTGSRPVTRRDPRNYAVYTHPLFVNDSTILAEKTCMDDVGRFVLVDRKTGRERNLLTPGFYIDGTTSIGGNFLVWSESVADRRWQNRSYAEIRMYDFKTGRLSGLSRESRYFAPVISPDGSRVAAVFITPENQSSIDILSVPSGKLVKRLPVAGQAITPNWSPDAKMLIFTLLAEKGETIATIDTATGQTRILAPWSFNEYNGPAFFKGNLIIYSTDISGIENVYTLDTLTRQVFQMTSAPYAALDPDFSSDRKRMIYSDYTSDGVMISEAGVDSARWIPLQQVKSAAYDLAGDLARQEKANVQDSLVYGNIYKMNRDEPFDLRKDTIRGRVHETRRYSRFLNLLNPHSWAPASIDVSNLTVMPGVSLLSQNLLGTMIAGAGWEYDVNERTGKYYASVTYKGWYPEIALRYDIGNRAGYARQKGSTDLTRFTWQESNFGAHVSIPLNLSHRKYLRYLKPSAGLTLIGVQHRGSTPEKFTSGSILAMDYRISASQYLLWNQKDMFPRWGETLDVTFRHTPFGGNNLGSVFGLSAGLYLPGIIRHHGILLQGGYQRRRENYLPSYSFADLIRFPRGYEDINDRDIYCLSVNYKMPLMYPDLSIGSLFYIKRIRMNLFYDWANGLNPGRVNTYQSAGGELTFDFHFLRMVLPIEAGVRTVYRPSDGGVEFGFVYAITY